MANENKKENGKCYRLSAQEFNSCLMNSMKSFSRATEWKYNTLPMLVSIITGMIFICRVTVDEMCLYILAIVSHGCFCYSPMSFMCCFLVLALILLRNNCPNRLNCARIITWSLALMWHCERRWFASRLPKHAILLSLHSMSSLHILWRVRQSWSVVLLVQPRTRHRLWSWPCILCEWKSFDETQLCFTWLSCCNCRCHCFVNERFWLHLAATEADHLVSSQRSGSAPNVSIF